MERSPDAMMPKGTPHCPAASPARALPTAAWMRLRRRKSTISSLSRSRVNWVRVRK